MCKETWVRYRRYQGPLAALKVRRGELLRWPRAHYQRKSAYPVNMAISLNATAALALVPGHQPEARGQYRLVV